MVISVDAARESSAACLSRSFSDIIASLTIAELSALRSSRQFRFQACTGDARLTDLLDWDALWKLIGSGAFPLWKLRVSYGRRIVQPMFYSDQGSIKANRLAGLIEQGCSIIAGRIESHVPAIETVCRNAESHGLPIAEVGAIVTSGSGGAFPRHYDMHDMVILQIEGRKRWRVFGPRVVHPIRESCCKNPPRTAPLFDRVFAPGDLLFLPSGFWHECDNECGRSLHLGLFMDPPPAADRTD